MDDEKKYVLSHLYEELRHYRSKEFQTFIFSFPIIASALLPAFSTVKSIIILVTLFALVMIHYIIKNHTRMLKIKRVIEKLQNELDINKHFHELDPSKWAYKDSFWKHLGTATYVVVLAIELIIIWRSPISQTLSNAAS